MSKMKLLSFNKAQIAFILFFLFTGVLFYLCTKLFFYDEDIFVVNPHSNFMLDFTRASIINLTFLSDNFFYKTNPAGYHCTNLLLHLVNTVLATYTFKALLAFTNPEQLQIRKASYIFFFLFLLSPIHSEPLCYLLGRAGLIVTLFCVLSFLFFLRATFKNPGLLIISLLFFLAALFSYEISWTFPLIIFCTSLYLKNYLKVTTKQIVIYTLPYFIVFAGWFLIKIIIINKLKIIPYGNNNFLSFDTLGLIKNSIVLFFRNFVPPFENTITFVILSIITALLLLYFFIMLKIKAREKLSFYFLLISILFLGFLPAVIFGINSHNSESERYIYFSSVFAIMFLATALSQLLKSKIVGLVTTIVCCMYSYSLFSTINNYVIGGRFAKNYLNILAEEQKINDNIYLINQPSQCNGALLFRAYGDKANALEKGSTTLQDFMENLYKKNSAKYITLSKKQITKTDNIKNIVRTSKNNIAKIFPEFRFATTKNFLINSSFSKNDTTFLKSGKCIIVGLKLPSIYIFN